MQGWGNLPLHQKRGNKMPKFIVVDDFKFNGAVRRSGSVLSIVEDDLKNEIAKGKHPKSKKYLSGLLNHCTPVDAEAEMILFGNISEKRKSEDIEAETTARMNEIYVEMDAMGAAYDRRWKIARLENELLKAKKIHGV